MSSHSLLDRKEVSRLTVLSRSTLYRFIREGTFPAPVQLGARRIAWRQDEVNAWIESRPATRAPSSV